MHEKGQNSVRKGRRQTMEILIHHGCIERGKGT